MLCVLTKIQHKYSIPIVEEIYLKDIERLQEKVNALTTLYPDENVVRMTPLPNPEQFDFVPKDLDETDETRSDCSSLEDPLTASNYEERLGQFFQSMYEASYGIKGLAVIEYTEWQLLLPVIYHETEE